MLPHWKASVVFALAFLLFFADAVSYLTMVGLIAVGGLVSAIDFVFTYLRPPPSIARFGRLNIHAGIAWFGLASAAIMSLYELPIDLSPEALDRVNNIGCAALLVGTVGHALWTRFVMRRRLRPQPGHPDFDEDEHGNPIRAG